RTFYRWNPDTTLMRTTADENRRIGEMLAAAANAATGPVAIVLPLRGLSMLDAEGREFWDPAADRACFRAIRATARADVPVIEIDVHINDPAFADRAVQELLRMLPDQTSMGTG
ncbi:MAG TPA: Tm-1-like ATP-binding domain-containing protein, partial [Candidatus Limnocylindria bacterium]